MKNRNYKSTKLLIFLFTFIILILKDIFLITISTNAQDVLEVYGEYPVVEELGKGKFEGKKREENLLIPYKIENSYRENAMVEALHFLSGCIYGYSFYYKPGSTLMKTEERFDISLRGQVRAGQVNIKGEGVWNEIYRVKIELLLTPSMEKWLSAFKSNRLRLEEAEGTSDFFTGWEGRSSAYLEALRNLVLISAKKRVSSRPLSIKGDIIIKGNPVFSVGAGRHYCRIQGYVNFIEIITYD